MNYRYFNYYKLNLMVIISLIATNNNSIILSNKLRNPMKGQISPCAINFRFNEEFNCAKHSKNVLSRQNINKLHIFIELKKK